MKSPLTSNLRALRVLATLAAITFSQPASAILDTNNNLLSDLWEKQHNNGNLFASTILATNDEDLDCWTNAQEAAAGTDPFDPNPPDGIVTVTLTPSLTEGAFTLTWPTLVGKNYQLKVSTDLLTWTNLGDPITTTQTTHSIGINTTQPDTTIPPKVFWRITVSDLDTDGDGLTDAEENELGTDRYSTNSIPGIPDLWLATHFSTLLLTNGIGGINMYADPDGDGYTNLEENLNGTDPNVSDAPTQQQWIIVKGDGPQGEPRTRIKQITIPKGQTRLVVVAIASEEYPQFTEPDDIEQFDDLLTWNIAQSGQTPIEGEVHVNDRHVDWELAEIDGQTLTGIPGPVHYEIVKTVTAPETSDLTIDVEISATNIADERLPSYVAVGLLPVEIQVKNDALGKWVTATELKIAKWQDAFDNNGFRNEHPEGINGIHSDVDRFRIRITTENLPEELRKIYISTTGSSEAEYNDNATEVSLEKDVYPYGPSDGFVSKPMILVADAVDNKFKTDNLPNDQTHISALGSHVEFRIKQANGDIVGRLPLLKKKTVHVDLILLWQGENGPTELALNKIAEDIKVTKEIHAQVGIEVTFTTGAYQVNESVDFSDGLTLSTTQNPGVLHSEGEAILNAFGTPNNQNDVIGLYIDGKIFSASSPNGEVQGTAFWDNTEVSAHMRYPISYWNDTVSATYKGNFLISISRLEENVLAHELGHVLGLLHPNDENLPEHRQAKRNLMQPGVSYDGLYREDTKRFIFFQENRMHNSQFIENAQND